MVGVKLQQDWPEMVIVDTLVHGGSLFYSARFYICLKVLKGEGIAQW